MDQSETDASIAQRLLVALATPFLLLVAIGVVLTLQVVRMERAAEWVTRSNELLGAMYDAQRRVVDQETGLRGYLVTEDRAFLEPYLAANPHEALSKLRAAVRDGIQVQRVDDVVRRYDAWATLSESVATGDVAVAPFKTLPAMRERKARMDQVRSAFDTLILEEQKLRAERAETSETAFGTTLYGVIPVLLAMGAALTLVSRKQITGISEIYRSALRGEQKVRAELEAQAWIRQGQFRVTHAAEGDPSLDVLAERMLSELAATTEAICGALYAAEPGGFRRVATLALGADAPARFSTGEGLLGAAARADSVTVVEDGPEDYLVVRSATGKRAPARLLFVPARVDGEVHAVVELGFFRRVEPRAVDLANRICEPMGWAFRSQAHRQRMRELLEESQRQSEELQTQQEELQTQQEELRVANEELTAQSDALRFAQGQLEERREELETINANLLSERTALEQSQEALAAKTSEAEASNRYKSQFLANMSHELRTPLNSSLILAKLLADNKTGNLTPEQVRFAQTIVNSGNDLLELINDVLDLSKVEAGKIDLHVAPTTVGRLVTPLVQMMEPVAAEKNLAFSAVTGHENEALETDLQRAQQILVNLLSNAFKFTASGGVTVGVALPDNRIEISVTDTGIGIEKEQQGVIFEAFRQADGTTNRKFGGTGLGLSISRDLARLLGGELRVDSEPGRGSTFILSLPRTYAGPVDVEPRPRVSRSAPPPPRPAPPRASAQATGRRLLLVVEDDASFAEIVKNLATELDFECEVASTAEDGVRIALATLPSAIILDMKLPDHSGLSVLDRLKHEPGTRHIPIHVISAGEKAEAALAMGAIGYLRKPVSREAVSAVLEKLKEPFPRLRRLLVVEDDSSERAAIEKLLEAPDLQIVAVATVSDALTELSRGGFDCIVTDLTLPDASGYDLIEKIAKDDSYSFPPIVVYTGREITREEEQRLRRYSSSIIVKGARSPERLLDEITLFLHQVEADLPPDRQRMLRQARNREAVFEGRKVLLAEDDVRNIFALSSALEPRGMTLSIARNGREALEVLEAEDVDLILMDIMMPEMDGLAAMEKIRARKDQKARVPIIAITAKAMRDDQERCLAAGANDCAPKPLDIDVLLSLMRVWMPQ